MSKTNIKKKYVVSLLFNLRQGGYLHQSMRVILCEAVSEEEAFGIAYEEVKDEKEGWELSIKVVTNVSK